MIITGLLTLSAFGPPGMGRMTVWLHSSLGLVLLPLAFLWHAVTGFARRYRLLTRAFHPAAPTSLPDRAGPPGSPRECG